MVKGYILYAKLMQPNFCRMENVPTTAKKKLITTDQTSPLEKSLNLITAEA